MSIEQNFFANFCTFLGSFHEFSFFPPHFWNFFPVQKCSTLCVAEECSDVFGECFKAEDLGRGVSDGSLRDLQDCKVGCSSILVCQSLGSALWNRLPRVGLNCYACVNQWEDVHSVAVVWGVRVLIYYYYFCFFVEMKPVIGLCLAIHCERFS